jgi:hypothetical protein
MPALYFVAVFQNKGKFCQCALPFSARACQLETIKDSGLFRKFIFSPL